MGCGCSATAGAQASHSKTISVEAGKKLVRGQSAIVRNSPNALLNGSRVICEEFKPDLNEWFVRGDSYPLSGGMCLAEHFLENADLRALSQSFDSVQSAPILLGSGSQSLKLRKGKYADLLKSKLQEKCDASFKSCSKEDAMDAVSDVYGYANGIIQQRIGLGPSGECPFASANEVQLYHLFCLNVLLAWSGHEMGQDEQMDKDFFSLIKFLSEILFFLDTDAVDLPDEIEQNIESLQHDVLFPNLVRGQVHMGEASVALCLDIGKKWDLEETKAFKDARTAALLAK